uniref:Uncharacterized protein n=1 Tax=Micrurus surinamensis TaxID=129470 RepID=A0A2D4NTU2_MICSU
MPVKCFVSLYLKLLNTTVKRHKIFFITFIFLIFLRKYNEENHLIPVGFVSPKMVYYSVGIHCPVCISPPHMQTHFCIVKREFLNGTKIKLDQNDFATDYNKARALGYKNVCSSKIMIERKE